MIPVKWNRDPPGCHKRPGGSLFWAGGRIDGAAALSGSGDKVSAGVSEDRADWRISGQKGVKTGLAYYMQKRGSVAAKKEPPETLNLINH